MFNYDKAINKADFVFKYLGDTLGGEIYFRPNGND